MEFLIGFLVWIGIAILVTLLLGTAFRGTPGTTTPVAFILCLLGTFIGGMLAESAYIYHDPNPLRIGGLIGAALGGLFFTGVYFFVGRKLV